MCGVMNKLLSKREITAKRPTCSSKWVSRNVEVLGGDR